MREYVLKVKVTDALMEHLICQADEDTQTVLRTNEKIRDEYIHDMLADCLKGMMERLFPL